jgi:hypothetical protein
VEFARFLAGYFGALDRRKMSGIAAYISWSAIFFSFSLLRGTGTDVPQLSPVY